MKLVIKVYCGWPVDTTSHILVDNGSQGRRKKCLDFFKNINYVTVTLGSLNS